MGRLPPSPRRLGCCHHDQPQEEKGMMEKKEGRKEGRKEEWMDGRNEGRNEQKGGRDLDERNEGTTTRDREGTRTRDIQESPEGAILMNIQMQLEMDGPKKG